jgi:uncharacterized iron-regulated membrane protein
LFNWRLTGKARDFNWHNTIGFWCAPVLIVLTITAVPISFRWGNDLVYRLVGEESPVRGGPPGATAAASTIAAPTPDAEPISYHAMVARVQQQFPRWQQITLRSGTGPQRGGVSSAAAVPAAAGNPASATNTLPPFTVIVREAGSWPRTANTTLTVDPFTGEALKREAFSDLSTGRQIRTWTRFLHTGQALGWGGQFVAGLASLGGVFLVYTGFALSWRRFFGSRVRVASSPPARAASTERATSVR